MSEVVVSGSFDDLRSRHMRLLQEAAKLGSVHVQLWSHELCRKMTGEAPKFPLAEREYFVAAIRYVSRVSVVDEPGQSISIPESQLAGFPVEPERPVPAGRKKVIVTGCYDWMHTGHVRFFEEVSELGALYAVAGSDKNIEFLKGPGHPLIREDERRYMIGSLRYVHQALIATGHGWLDAEPEIVRIRPDIYAVNEDGDKPEKRDYCQKHGIEYVVLKRLPKPGLTRRSSTALRGF